MSKRKTVRNVAYFSTILILVLVMIFSGLQILESTVLSDGQEQETKIVSKTIDVDGVRYFPRQDITVMMVMGIDQEGPVQDSGSYMNPGAADMVMLMIFDEKDESYSVLTLNRDTMVDVQVLGIGGKPAGSVYGQLALSHTYGSGLEDSCENVVDTVSAFLNGIRIDYYFAMHMDAIGMLNDAVGGVTVNVVDDFSGIDPTIQKGLVTLRSGQAEVFLRSRRGLGDQLNISRMERHKTYMDSFADALRAKVDENDTFVVKTYEEISPYVVTDCSTNVLTSMMNRYGAFELKEIVSPEGNNTLAEEYVEFYADREKLDELILRLFYAPK